jgi:hypothetical protein
MATKEAMEPRSAAYSCAQSVHFMVFDALNILIDAGVRRTPAPSPSISWSLMP